MCLKVLSILFLIVSFLVVKASSFNNRRLSVIAYIGPRKLISKLSYLQKEEAVETISLCAQARGESRRKSSLSQSYEGISVTQALVGINVLVFLFTLKKPWRTNQFLKNNFLIARGQWYRVVTALFLHGSVPHIAMNTMSLLNIGPQVESIFGPWGYLLLYIGSGAIANTATYLLGSSPYSLGASGSTFGLLGAYAAYIYVNRRNLGSRSSLILDNIKRNVITNVMYGFMQSNIDNGAHIGGFAAGALLSLIIRPTIIPPRRTNIQRRNIRR